MEEERFRIGLLGYSKKQVRRYVRNMKSRTEALLMEKQERLLALRDENLRLKEQLEEYKKREGDVAGALVEARAQARRVLMEAHARMEEEQAAARETLRRLDERIAVRREALCLVARNMERLAAEFGRAAVQQDRILSLPQVGEEAGEKEA